MRILFGFLIIGLSICANFNVPCVEAGAAPTVVTTSPGNGETGVATDLSLISITFSKQMDTASSISSSGWPFAQSGQYWSADRKTFHFPRDPNTQLEKCANVTLTLNPPEYPEFRDIDGNLLGTYTFSFATEGDGACSTPIPVGGKLEVYLRASQEDMNNRMFKIEFRETLTEGTTRVFEFPDYGTPRNGFITPFVESPNGECAFDSSGNKITYEFKGVGEAIYGYTVHPTADHFGSGYCNKDIGVFDIWGSFPQVSVVNAYDEVNLTFDVPDVMPVYSPFTKESGRVIKLVENGVHPQILIAPFAWGNFSNVETLHYGDHTFYMLGYNTDCTYNFELAKASYAYFMKAVTAHLDSLLPATLYIVLPSEEGNWGPLSEGIGGTYGFNAVGDNWSPIFRNSPSECGGAYLRWTQNGDALTVAPVHQICHATIVGFINDWWPVEGIAVYYQIVMLNKVGILDANEAKREFLAHLECYQNEIVGSVNDYALKDFEAFIHSDYVTKMIAYIKGALVFYTLNEIIKETSNGESEVIDLFVKLYGMFKEGYSNDYSTFITALDSLTGRNFQEFFDKYVYGTEPLPLEIKGNDIVLTYMPPAGTPLPDIKANNQDSLVTVSYGSSVSVDVKLYPSIYVNNNADWWVVELTPSGNFYYDLSKGSMVSGLLPTLQGPLFNLGTTTLLNTSDLSVGTHTFYFGVDLKMNGSLDMDSIYYDWVTVNVTGP